MKFYSFDLDLNPMTLVLKLDLDIVQIYMCTDNECPSFSSSELYSLNRYTDTQIDKQI